MGRLFLVNDKGRGRPGVLGEGCPAVKHQPFSPFATVFPERFFIQGGVPRGNDGVGKRLFGVLAAFLRQGQQELSVPDEPFAVACHLIQVSLGSHQPRPAVQDHSGTPPVRKVTEGVLQAMDSRATLERTS